MNQQETLERIFFEHDPAGTTCKIHDLYDEYRIEAKYFLALTEGTTQEKLNNTFRYFFAPLNINVTDDLINDINESLYY
jgi:hypothetical protein